MLPQPLFFNEDFVVPENDLAFRYSSAVHGHEEHRGSDSINVQIYIIQRSCAGNPYFDHTFVAFAFVEAEEYFILELSYIWVELWLLQDYLVRVAFDDIITIQLYTLLTVLHLFILVLHLFILQILHFRTFH